jgi:DNA repair protein RecN (Recombination protein N)
MLSHIFLRDFAIIEKLDLELHPGMTVLTGETGAGKSILIDAIGLVLGDRADSGVVRHGATKAEITLTIDIDALPSAQQWLQAQDMDADDVCMLRRVINANGKSRAWINGSPVNLTMLRQLGEQLVDIHGQHEHQALMKKDMQRLMLDDFADNQSLLSKVAQSYRNWKECHERLETLSSQNADHQTRLDFLTFQVQELENLQLTENEVEILDEEHSRLSNAGQLMQTAELSCSQLYDADESVYSMLSGISQNLEQQARVDADLKEPAELITSAQIQIQEAASLLRHYLDRLELDPERLSWVENRIADIQDMARKHRVDSHKLSAKLVALQTELATLTGDDYDLEALEKKLQQHADDYLKQANKLRQSRIRAARKLSADVSEAMQTLGMQGGKFEIVVAPVEDKKFLPNGIDHIEFEVSANPGQPVKPLAKVASGGELSRISLAIQMIAAQKVTLPALIFDEVDTGIGGGTAEIVGKQLRKLGSGRQVLCVTHLPQVAAQGHQHYKVTKIKGKNSTSTGMLVLNEQERIEEIARMIGGIEITDSTLKLAKEMISSRA